MWRQRGCRIVTTPVSPPFYCSTSSFFVWCKHSLRNEHIISTIATTTTTTFNYISLSTHVCRTLRLDPCLPLPTIFLFPVYVLLVDRPFRIAILWESEGGLSDPTLQEPCRSVPLFGVRSDPQGGNYKTWLRHVTYSSQLPGFLFSSKTDSSSSLYP